MAKERAAKKDNYGEFFSPGFLSIPDSYLQKVAGGVRVSLGNKLEVVKHNLNLIKAIEQARVDLWLAEYNKNQKQTSLPEETDIIDTGEHSMEDLLEQGDNDEEREEEEHWDMLRGVFSSTKGKDRSRNTRGSGVTTVVVIKTLELSARKKKKKRGEVYFGI